MTLNIIAFGLKSPRTTKLSIMTMSLRMLIIKTFNITTLSIKTLSIKTLIRILNLIET